MRINITSGSFLAYLLHKERGPVSNLLIQNKNVFSFGFLLTFFTELMSITPIIYMMNMFDRVMSSRSEVTLISLTLLLIALLVFWSSLDWVKSRLFTRLSMRLDWDLSVEVFDATFRRFAGRKRVNVQQVMGDLFKLRQFIQGSTLMAIMEAPFAVLVLAILWFMHPYLAVFAVVMLLILLILAYLKQRAATPLIKLANEATAETDRMVLETLRQSESAMALGMLPQLRKRWYERHKDDLMLQANGYEASGLIGGFSTVLTRAVHPLTIGLGVYLAISGEISGGAVIAAMFLVRKAIHPLQTLLNNWSDIITSKLALERLDKMLADDVAWKDRMTLPEPKGELEVAGVLTMTNNNRRYLLSGINFALHPGQMLAVVGPSTAGKSTLVKHLVGIMKPTSGSVRLDGAEVADWVRSDLGRHIGYVPQEVTVFEGSVAENIARMGNVDSDSVIKAAQQIGFHKSILSFPDGYDTQLGEGGYFLTGGQKQRLGIARALYGNPNYIVMDEPSASLDAAAEEALFKCLGRLKKRKCTVIVTTHRPNILSAADLLLVLNQGKQMAFGPPAVVQAMANKQLAEGENIEKSRLASS
jgi:PrtD family type I secretion system ABC transporter